MEKKRKKKKKTREMRRRKRKKKGGKRFDVRNNVQHEHCHNVALSLFT
jgi:hypothetical protein